MPRSRSGSSSVRTVETHLYRVFKKIGIDEREQLADLLG
jgi:DNA-binding CsgD family transcriptional regulator